MAAAQQLAAWATVFAEAGYAPVVAGWPDDPDTVAEANANPQVFARKSVGDVADHFCELIGKLDRKPAVVGHSFGGLITQISAGRGLSAASVAIDPAPFRGRGEPEPVDRGQGRHRQPGTGAAADHLRREGPHRPVGHRQRRLQTAEGQHRRHRDRRDPDRGHSLTIDNGWRQVCDTALAFIRRFH